ncbi:MAG: hypothetical protein AMXMBFR82_12680 [Candidatus Hydrogenedentota bacterium]
MELYVGNDGSQDAFFLPDTCTFTATALRVEPTAPQEGQLNVALTPEWFWVQGDDEYWARKDLVANDNAPQGLIKPGLRVFQQGTGGGARYQEETERVHIPPGQMATFRFVFPINNVATADLDVQVSQGDKSKTYRIQFVQAHESQPY